MATYRWFLLFLALACLPAVLAGQESSKAASVTETVPDTSGEAAVIEKFSTRVTFENDGTSTREVAARIHIQSDAGVQNFGVLVFSYANSSESMSIDYVRVHKPDGSVVETPADNIQDMPADITRVAPFYSDLRQKHVAVKGLGAGDELEYLVHWQLTKPLAPGQFWYADNFLKDGIVLQEELQITVPRDRALKWSSPKIKPVITEDATHRIFTWTSSNLAKKPEDEDHSLESATGTFPPPDVELSTFQSWDEVGRWYGNLQHDRVQPSPAVRAKAEELTKGLTDDDAKIRALYKFVSGQFRYIGVAFGIGRYQPHSADDILSNQYGDCKDKHTLLASLLQAVGIQAYPALISSSHAIDPDVPSPGQFDHVITFVPRGKDALWLDTTPEIGPFGYLITPLRNKPALVIAADKPAAFATTVAQPPFVTSQTFRAEGKLSDAGVLTAKMDQTVRGDSEVVFRAVFRSIAQSNWKELVQNISYRMGFGGTVSNISASSPEATDSAFHLSYDYTRNDYSDWENRRITPPMPPIFFAAIKDNQTKFTEPLWLGTPGTAVFDAKIELPTDYSVESLPPDVNLQTDFAEYHSSYKHDGGMLIAERRFTTKLNEVPVAEFQQFKSFRKGVEDDQNKYIVLTQSAGTKAEGGSGDQKGLDIPDPVTAFQKAIHDLPDSSNPEASRLAEETQAAVGRNDPFSVIASLKDSVAADPKYARGWIMLGSLLMATGQPEEAVKAFHSAIDAAPKAPAAYKAVGLALLSSNKPGEAVPILQKLCQLSPDDVGAQTYLARAYLSSKRYSEAAATYEAAAKFDSKDPALFNGMGTAYLRAGNDEKATAAYGRALALNNTPMMFNDIAYEMAVANKDLPHALEYATRAVNMEEEACAKVQLSSLQKSDLPHMSSIAASWDTLGWVFFRMNKLADAEKYLDAAWTLSLDPIVADHLGQVYALEHKRQSAIRMEQVALAAGMRIPGDERQELIARLEQLSPGSSKMANRVIDSSTNAMNETRTIKLPRITTQTASAEFFLLFSRGTNGSSNLDDVKFISGSPALKSGDKTLRSAHFKVLFPDDQPTRLVRRGVLSCHEYAGCSLVLYTPDSVHSVD